MTPLRSLFAALLLPLCATAAHAQAPAEQKCGAASCGKKEQTASCSKKEASCSKKEASCSKKEASCSKK